MSRTKARDAAGAKGKGKSNSATSRKASKDVERAEAGKFAPGNANAWKPGQSGNPAGRPKSKTLSEAIRERLAEECEFQPGLTWAAAIAERLCRVALYGGGPGENSTAAAKEIADRTEGKARQPLELDAKDDVKKVLASLLGVPVEQLPAPREPE